MRSRKLIASLIGVVAFFTLATLMSAQTFQTIFDFDLWDGKYPDGIVFDKAGNLYGTTSQGGTNSYGVIVKLAPNADGSWTRTVLHTFSGPYGELALGPLTFDPAGNLYGTTNSGGASHDGVVFQLVPNSNGTWTENVLHSFNGTDGYAPSSAVIFDQAGNLYGTTVGGGSTFCGESYGCGVVYKLAPNSDGSWSESTIYAFCSQKGCRDGSAPQGESLIFDQAGSLYGTTLVACSQGYSNLKGCEGTVFKLSPNADGSWSESVLHHFCSWGSSSTCKDGVFPVDLIMDQAGNLYGGATSPGAPIVFELSPNADGSWSEKVLHYFPGTNNAAQPQSLVFDAAGNLYGAWNLIESYGEVFKLSPNSNGQWTETVVHAFQGSDGSLPDSLIFDSAGHLFGTTYAGGTNGYGTVFEITP
jgi:uncharacterized repeat protein (TIGR03803 family)